MEPYVSRLTNWRKKIGIHLGGGLQDGVEATLGGRDRKIEAYKTSVKGSLPPQEQAFLSTQPVLMVLMAI